MLHQQTQFISQNDRDEIRRRIERAIESRECAPMNNTKWRKVLNVIAQARRLD